MKKFFFHEKSSSTSLRMTAFKVAQTYKGFGWLHLELVFPMRHVMVSSGGESVGTCTTTAYRRTRRRCESPQQVLPKRCRPHVTVLRNKPRRLATNPVAGCQGTTRRAASDGAALSVQGSVAWWWWRMCGVLWWRMVEYV